jgi:hypothetical protein
MKFFLSFIFLVSDFYFREVSKELKEIYITIFNSLFDNSLIFPNFNFLELLKILINKYFETRSSSNLFENFQKSNHL